MGVPFKTIVVYVDGSEDALNAIMYSILLARQNNAKLIAVSVVNMRALNELVHAGIFVSAERIQYQKELQGDSVRYLRHAKRLAEQKNVEMETVSFEGTVHSEVVKLLKERKADLLVVGGVTQIRSRREELSSETDRMMRSCPCPVLVVKDDDLWQEFDSIR